MSRVKQNITETAPKTTVFAPVKKKMNQVPEKLFHSSKRVPEKALTQPKPASTQRQPVTEAPKLPTRPVCRLFQMGRCSAGSKCKFLHISKKKRQHTTNTRDMNIEEV